MKVFQKSTVYTVDLKIFKAVLFDYAKIPFFLLQGCKVLYFYHFFKTFLHDDNGQSVDFFF